MYKIYETIGIIKASLMQFFNQSAQLITANQPRGFTPHLAFNSRAIRRAADKIFTVSG
jgi:hypothetical protein